MSKAETEAAEKRAREAAEAYPESDPRHHTAYIRSILMGLSEHLERDVAKVEDPRAEALFETTREVIGGLQKAYEHFDAKSESAWR